MPAPPLPLLLPALDLSPVEAVTEAAGQALEQALLPLSRYCARVEGRADLTDYQFRHVATIRAALDAVETYSTQLWQLLTATRANVTGLNRQLHHAYSDRPQTLEKAMQVDWESIALSLLDRLQHPASVPASPLVVRVRRHLAELDRRTPPLAPLAHAA